MMRPFPLLLLPLALIACQAKPPQAPAAAAAGPAAGTPEWKIQDAMSAAPQSVSANATIMDYPASPTAKPTTLRAGTNGWTCFPDAPGTPHDDPMCVDANWMMWMEAFMAHKPPALTHVGLAYMLKGAADADNNNPYAEKPPAGKDWVHTGPHVMLLVPDAKALAGLPTTPTPNTSYVMFPGTPYAHLMWLVQ